MKLRHALPSVQARYQCYILLYPELLSIANTNIVCSTLSRPSLLANSGRRLRCMYCYCSHTHSDMFIQQQYLINLTRTVHARCNFRQQHYPDSLETLFCKLFSLYCCNIRCSSLSPTLALLLFLKSANFVGQLITPTSCRHPPGLYAYPLSKQ